MARRSLVSARVLFAVGSWGLGHATRDLPLIRGLLDAGHRVTVAGSGASLHLLQGELGGQCRFVELPGMRVPLGRTPFRFYLKYTLLLPLIWWDTVRQHEQIETLLRRERFDVLVSDNRYAAWTRQIPSFLIAHGLRFIAPGRKRLLERGLEWFNATWFRPYQRILVPDFESNDLSGDLSHRLHFYSRSQVRYIGLLSSVRARDCPADLDVFVSISGPEPQRSILERTITKQIANVDARGLIALGRPGTNGRRRIGGWDIAGYLGRDEQEQAMNRCRMAVVRAGYSTIMELAELYRPAVLIPTPGQTEQEYISSYQAEAGHHFAAEQSTLDLAKMLAAGSPPWCYEPPHLTDVSVRRFLEEVLG